MKMLMIILTLVSSAAFASEGEYTNKYKPEAVDSTLAQRPALTKLSAPAALSKIDGLETELKWETVQGAEGYHIQVSEDPGFFRLHLDIYQPETSTKVAGLEAGKIYYWRVASTKGSNLRGYTHGTYTRSSFSTK